MGWEEQPEMACHTEAKQTQISAVYLKSPRLIFMVVLGAVVISLPGVRGRSLHFPWNFCWSNTGNYRDDVMIFGLDKMKYGAEITDVLHFLPLEGPCWDMASFV